MGIQEDLNFLSQQTGINKTNIDTVVVQEQLKRMAQENEARDSTLVGQTNPRPLIEDLKHYYRCEVEVPNGKGGIEWKRPEGINPLLNEIGVHSIIADVFGLVNQGTILSNITDDDVSKLTIETAWTVVKKLKRQREKFECDESNMTSVIITTSNMCYMALKRGLNQGERGFLKKTVFSNESHNTGGNFKSTDKKFWEVWK